MLQLLEQALSLFWLVGCFMLSKLGHYFQHRNFPNQTYDITMDEKNVS